MNTLSGVLFFAAFLPYVFAIMNYDTVPSPVTWAIWATVDTLVLFAMNQKRVEAMGQIIGAVSGAWVITTLAIFYGKPTIGVMEFVSIAGAGFGIFLWKKTGNPVLAIACSQAAIFIGAVPTIANAYVDPSQEDALAWTIWFCSCVCALFAIKKWDLANALQPVNFTIIETIMVTLVVVRPQFT